MRKLFLFMLVSLDGYFEGQSHDITWHNVDEEFNEYAIEQLSEVDTLLFGRKTYELMASYWSTESAQNDDPIVAEKMNSTSKIVFSKTLKKAEWDNTRLLKKNLTEEVAKLKQGNGKDIGIFGSNNLSVQLIENGLIDEVRIIINPVVLGSGNPLFTGIKDKLNLKLINTKTFKNGNVLLRYLPN